MHNLRKTLCVKKVNKTHKQHRKLYNIRKQYMQSIIVGQRQREQKKIDMPSMRLERKKGTFVTLLVLR